MTLQNQIKTDFQNDRKNINRANVLKLLIAEMQREPTKNVDDNKVIKIIKRLIENETQLKNADTFFIQTLSDYLPKQESEKTIIEWIKNNIDFTQYKNKMQSMKTIINHFGTTTTGDQIKQILQEKF